MKLYYESTVACSLSIWYFFLFILPRRFYEYGSLSLVRRITFVIMGESKRDNTVEIVDY